jgi:hypothetical protein
MQIFQVLLALAPKIFAIAQQGQAAWVAFLEAQKVEGDEAINAGLDALKSEFTRRRLIAEFESGGAIQ